MPNLFRSRSFLISIGVLAIIFIIAVVIRVLLPPEPTVPVSTLSTTNRDGSTTTYGSITFTGQLFSLPNKLPVYSVITTDPISTTKTLTQRLNVLTTQTVGVWENEAYLLVQDPYTNLITLLVKNKPETSSAVSSSADAVVVAQNFLNELGLNNYVPLTNLVTEQPFEAEQEYGNSGLANASTETVYAVPFSVEVAGYPLYLGDSRSLPLRVMVEKSGAINTMLFEPTIPALNEIGPKTILTSQQSLENLKQGAGSIITANSDSNVSTLSLSRLDQLTLTTLELEYRVDIEQQLAYPFFRFTGTAVQGNRQITVEVITPAVTIN